MVLVKWFKQRRGSLRPRLDNGDGIEGRICSISIRYGISVMVARIREDFDKPLASCQGSGHLNMAFWLCLSIYDLIILSSFYTFLLAIVVTICAILTNYSQPNQVGFSYDTPTNGSLDLLT